jgi:hypothetical protein
MAIDVGVMLVPWGCLYPFFYIKGGEVIRKVIELVIT